MKIIFLTAGAAGMYCGSCLHDNQLARAIIARGHQCLLQPLYTPIRTDGVSAATQRVFFGGIHIYLLDQLPGFVRVPRVIRKLFSPLRWLLNYPPLVRWITRRFRSTDAESLGHLTVSMLKGRDGPTRDEVDRLLDFVASEDPDAVVLSNLLIGGFLPDLKRRCPSARLAVLLQGDDLFLDHLSQTYQRQVIELMSQKVQSADRWITHSNYYADYMAERLNLDADRFDITPLSIDCEPFQTSTPTTRPDQCRLVYMARLAPEKGYDLMVDAFIRLAAVRPTLHLDVAGYRDPGKHRYLSEQIEKIARAGLDDRFIDHGEVTLRAKSTLLGQGDVMCVPARYRDPKGLFILESLAAGTAVVAPDHGALGDLVRQTGGGLTFTPESNEDLDRQLLRLIDDADLRHRLSTTGRQHVQHHHDIDAGADRLVALLSSQR